MSNCNLNLLLQTLFSYHNKTIHYKHEFIDCPVVVIDYFSRSFHLNKHHMEEQHQPESAANIKDKKRFVTYLFESNVS
jgi:hypothetical protein